MKTSAFTISNRKMQVLRMRLSTRLRPFPLRKSSWPRRVGRQLSTMNTNLLRYKNGRVGGRVCCQGHQLYMGAGSRKTTMIYRRSIKGVRQRGRCLLGSLAGRTKLLRLLNIQYTRRWKARGNSFKVKHLKYGFTQFKLNLCLMPVLSNPFSSLQ